MLEVLFFSQRDVKARLFARVDAAQGLLLITAVRHGAHMRPLPEREPFRTLERRYGDFVDQLVVADEGTLEGMWRDPVGDLADRLYPDDRAAAYAAANGYLLLKDGEVEAVVKKRKDPVEDLWFLQEALAAAHPQIPRPTAAQRPRTTEAPGAPPPPPPKQPPRESKASAPERPWRGEDPYAILGLARGVSLGEAKKAFRTLVAQYHPDKVAHLAPEFRELAEVRTRQIMAAWEALEAELAD